MFTRDFYIKFRPYMFEICVKKFSHYNFLDLNCPNNARQQMPGGTRASITVSAKAKATPLKKFRSFPLNYKTVKGQIVWSTEII